jgi:hypothetical protein
MRFNSLGFVLLCASAAITGCDSADTPSTLKDNSGSTLTTSAGQQITPDMLYGKWDLDGERTNKANGSAGIDAIPSDITKDVLGKGWRFEANGVLKTDDVVGSKPGSWRLEGGDTLVIQEAGQVEPRSYDISFRNGFMYLRGSDGKYMVMEKDKFFGF